MLPTRAATTRSLTAPVRHRVAACSAALLVGAALWHGGARAQTQSVAVPPPTAAALAPASRWDSTLAAFAAADKLRQPASDGVLFVGSSTIRMWSKLAEDFRQHPVVINRGFGGSTMAECQQFVRQLVLQYRPRQVLVYAGDNDLAEGRSPAQVKESFEAFVTAVRAELPATRIAYISVKPSPLRVNLLDKARETNARIADYLAGVPNSQYIDIFTPMLDATGQPRAELYGADRLHLNDAGYRLWQSVIAAYLPEVPAAGVPQLAAANPAPPAATAAQPSLVAPVSVPAVAVVPAARQPAPTPAAQMVPVAAKP